MTRSLTGALAALCVLGSFSVPTTLEAQAPEDGRWPLQPVSRAERVVAPFLEGWYLNDDGSVTYSFGYLNLNEEIVRVPTGEQNLIEPVELGGMQPSVFLPGRRRGVFAVTVPASMSEDDVWWRITNANGEVTEVPGSASWNAYRLDWTPRPHGGLPPEVSFEGGQRSLGPGKGPAGVMAERVVTARAGLPTTLSVHVKEVSMRMPGETDPTVLAGPSPLRVVWTPYRAPAGGVITFERHESMPDVEPRHLAGWKHDGDECYSAMPCAALDDAQLVDVPSGEGTVRVSATFSEPGEYWVLVQVNNWGRPDSGFGDQCCHGNGYVRVTVEE